MDYTDYQLKSNPGNQIELPDEYLIVALEYIRDLRQNGLKGIIQRSDSYPWYNQTRPGAVGMLLTRSIAQLTLEYHLFMTTQTDSVPDYGALEDHLVLNISLWGLLDDNLRNDSHAQYIRSNIMAMLGASPI